MPVYRTTATLLIEEGKNQAPLGTAEILEGIGLQPGNRNLDNQIQILGSYSLIEKTLEELPFGIDCYRMKEGSALLHVIPQTPFRLYN